MILRKYSPQISITLLLIYLTFIVGCNYYKIKTIDTEETDKILKQVRKKEKYIILHTGNNALHLTNININDKEGSLTANTEPVGAYHQHYKYVKKQYANRYKKSARYQNNYPIYEVHLYTNDSIHVTENTKVTLPINTLKKIEVYSQDVGTTVFSFLGITLLATILLVAIIAATKSSCPFVYINTPDDFVFAGEIYGGAIYSSLERNDYLPLPGFEPIDKKYAVRISNELKERQYTNLANLIVVEHPELSNVLIDKNGNIQTLTDETKPEGAYTDLNADVKSLIVKKDSIAYLFDNENLTNNICNLTLTFKKPTDAKTAKLVINAKNSYWLDYAYGKFTELFGTYYNKFAEKQKSVPAEKNLQWTLEQGIPLSVYLKTETGWEFVDYFHSMGPLASRDLVMPINIAKIKGESVTIKLECGFMFWEVDYAAMDFSKNISIQTHVLKSLSAMDENGKDVSPLLVDDDNLYLAQPDIGDVATIEYSAPIKSKNLKHTIFLHSKGYYEYIRDYKNWPDITYLQSFKTKGAFTQFAKEHYNALTKSNDLWASALNQSKEK